MVLAAEGENSYTLTCSSQNDGQPVTSKVSVQATAVTKPDTGTGGTGSTGNNNSGNNSGNSNGGGGGPLSALLLAPLAVLAWTRRRVSPSSQH